MAAITVIKKERGRMKEVRGDGNNVLVKAG